MDGLNFMTLTPRDIGFIGSEIELAATTVPSIGYAMKDSRNIKQWQCI